MIYQFQIESEAQPPLLSHHPVTWEETSTWAGFARIFEPSVHLVCMRRALPTGIQDYLHAMDRAGFRADRIRLIHSLGAPIPTDVLPDLPGRAAVRAEIEWMSELLADVTGCPQIGLRIEVLDRAMCPRMHVDHVAVRLLTTWSGPGTEWLDESGADRSRLGSDDVIRTPAAVCQARAGDVLMLKGERWPGNEGYGVLHRSPAPDDTTRMRVLLACDAVW